MGFLIIFVHLLFAAVVVLEIQVEGDAILGALEGQSGVVKNRTPVASANILLEIRSVVELDSRPDSEGK